MTSPADDDQLPGPPPTTLTSSPWGHLLTDGDRVAPATPSTELPQPPAPADTADGSPASTTPPRPPAPDAGTPPQRLPQQPTPVPGSTPPPTDDDSGTTQPASRPQPPSAEQAGAGSPGATRSPQGRPSWGQPSTQHGYPPPPSVPPQRPAGPWSVPVPHPPPAPPHRQPPGMAPAGRRPGDTVVPGRDSPTRQFGVDTRLRHAAPARPPGASRRPEADHYRRAGAPMQAAYAGIRQELITTATEERSPVANTGWRGAVNSIGLKLAPSAKERRRRDVLRRIRAPKDAMYAIAVLTLRGGSGKTTVTATLGQVFSSVRPDGVIAVDADPDAGDLPMRTAVHPNNLSILELLNEDNLGQFDIVQRFLSTTDTDLQVLSNGWRPDSDRILEPADISDVHEIATHYYSMLLWDGDKALNSPVVREMLAKSNALVLLVEASRPGAVKAGQAIDWLRNHGFEGLLARTVLLVNETTADTRLDMESLLTVLARQQLKIHRVPFDPHLDEGLFIDLDKLKKKTRRAFEDLAALLADDFAVPQAPASVAAAS